VDQDAAAEAALLEHCRWLTDRQAERLASLESRGVAVLGWAATQVTLTLGVLTLSPNVRATGWRAAGVAVIGLAAVGSAVAAIGVTLGVLRASAAFPAPRVDLAPQHAALKAHLSEPDRLQKTLQALIASLLISSETSQAVLPAMKSVVDSRGKHLRCATVVMAIAVGLDGAGAALLAVAATR
jgi:hypothetical protein